MMTAELKAQLRAKALARRQREPLLKDLTPADLLIACDHAEESGIVLKDDPTKVKHCRLKLVSPAQEAALNSRLPHAARQYMSRGGQETYDGFTVRKVSRTTSVWQLDAIMHVLAFCGVQQPWKYVRYWTPRRTVSAST